MDVVIKLTEQQVEQVGQSIAGSKREKLPRLMDVKRTAAFLGHSENAVRELVRKGTLQPVRINGRIFFDREYLERFIQERQSSD